MPIAQVVVLHAIRRPNGQWLQPGPTELSATEAATYPPGYLEILSIDGAEHVKPACCAGD